MSRLVIFLLQLQQLLIMPKNYSLVQYLAQYLERLNPICMQAGHKTYMYACSMYAYIMHDCSMYATVSTIVSTTFKLKYER